MSHEKSTSPYTGPGAARAIQTTLRRIVPTPCVVRSLVGGGESIVSSYWLVVAFSSTHRAGLPGRWRDVSVLQPRCVTFQQVYSTVNCCDILNGQSSENRE